MIRKHVTLSISLAALALSAVACGSSTPMKDAESAKALGRAADRSSQATAELERQRLNQRALQASEARVAAEKGEMSPEEKELGGAGTVDTTGTTLFLNCGEGESEGPGFVVRVDGDEAEMYLPGGAARLMRMEVDDGEMFTDGKNTLWVKGDAAVYQDAEGLRYMCSNSPQLAVWEDARLRGVQLRGVGEDWVLEMDPNTTVFIAEGSDRTDFETPDPVERDDLTLYFVRTPDKSLELKTTAGECIDPSTGEKLGLELELDVNGTKYEGCGRDLSGSASSANESLRTGF